MSTFNPEYRGAIVSAGGKGPARLQLFVECERQHSQVYIAADLDGAVFGALAVDPAARCSFSPPLSAAGWGAELSILDSEVDTSEESSLGVPRVEKGLRAARGQLTPTKLDQAPPKEGPDKNKLFAGWRKDVRKPAVATALGLPRVGRLAEVRFGVDGTDVVWSGGELDSGCVVLSGRYVEDPSQVVATRVVDLRCKDIESSWTMGCGWASTTTSEGQALVVSLKDGMTFRIPKLSAPLDTAQAANTSVLAFTCSEAIVAAGGPTPTVLRIPLDALPGGTPAPEPPRPVASAETDAGADASP